MIVRRMGEVYSSGDCVVTIAGIFDINPTAISYNQKNSHEYQRGIKRKPRGWRMGPKEYEGKITLPLDVIATLERFAPQGDLARIRPFPVNITYFNYENEMIHDYIYAKFTGSGREVTGDGELSSELELFVLDMKLNMI